MVSFGKKIYYQQSIYFRYIIYIIYLSSIVKSVEIARIKLISFYTLDFFLIKVVLEDDKLVNNNFYC